MDIDGKDPFLMVRRAKGHLRQGGDRKGAVEILRSCLETPCAVSSWLVRRNEWLSHPTCRTDDSLVGQSD